ncbi:unnamed protein product [Gongylonema pulchrum]|uniref:Peptidase_M13_N domain-containing protein n=1 Tax=Gongylonema pulchrum TaxID=637853 RepID=A0A183CWR1_9BILA|nr:unnamed protein product [Gongylonema pulchrum]
MVRELQASFKEMLLENDWLEESTRKKALKKADEMLSLIGYPDFIQNPEDLDEYYKLHEKAITAFTYVNVLHADMKAKSMVASAHHYLNIEPNDTYAQIVTKTSRWAMEHSFRKLVEPVKRTEFGASASTVNAFYSSLKNAVVAPGPSLLHWVDQSEQQM